MKSLTDAILHWGNTINMSLGYEISQEMPAKNLCENCHIPEKVQCMLSTELIFDFACKGCQCPIPH
jgi:hypothetical protein